MAPPSIREKRMEGPGHRLYLFSYTQKHTQKRMPLLSLVQNINNIFQSILISGKLANAELQILYGKSRLANTFYF